MAETLLALLSPAGKATVPVSFSLTTTPLALTLCRANPQLRLWVGSIAEAVETGEAYSQGFALSAPAELAEGLPRYGGPKVLIVDARSYSAADIFAAGWQDNDLGPILGMAERRARAARTCGPTSCCGCGCPTSSPSSRSAPASAWRCAARRAPAPTSACPWRTSACAPTRSTSRRSPT